MALAAFFSWNGPAKIVPEYDDHLNSFPVPQVVTRTVVVPDTRYPRVDSLRSQTHMPTLQWPLSCLPNLTDLSMIARSDLLLIFGAPSDEPSQRDSAAGTPGTNNAP